MVTQFKGDYRWLSNFAPCKIILEGVEYQSVEHAYMSAKSSDLDWKLFCRETEKAGDVKRASKNITLIPNWDNLKINVMKVCLEQKFSVDPYRSKLITTGSIQLIEGNTWNDKFWGVSLTDNQGQNNLGKLIMDIRDSLLKFGGN